MSQVYPQNFLDLVQRAFVECACSGSVPSTLVGVVGEAARIMNWTSSLWLVIQQMHEDWQFMESSFSFVTVNGQAYYTPTQCGIAAGTFGAWKRTEPFRNNLTTVGTDGEVEMGFREYESFRILYDFSTLKNIRTRPMDYTFAPDYSLGLGPYPNGLYTVNGKFFTAPVSLAADADVPTLDRQFLLGIVGGVMMEYAGFNAASEVYQRGKKWYDEYIGRLEKKRLPRIRAQGALC